MANMGLGALAAPETIFKRRFRWMFTIDGVCGDRGIDVLPPLKGARPNLAFKNIEVPHLIENVYLPGKPDWKPINLMLYDICSPDIHGHPVWDWIYFIYRPEKGRYFPIIHNGDSFKKQGFLKLYSGCGDIIESWTFENCWPEQINFGDLDMGNNEVITCDITLKYDRAWKED